MGPPKKEPASAPDKAPDKADPVDSIPKAADSIAVDSKGEASKAETPSRLIDELERKLQAGMTIPEPVRMLYLWIEERGLYGHDREGAGRKERRVGYLYPGATWSRSGDEEKFYQLHPEKKVDWTDTERSGGTIIRFAAEGNDDLKYLGHEKPEVMNRLCVFALTGGEGSRAAFWLDDEGRQRIVHLGSGSGSRLMCVLADDPVDFLRLIAIGYDELCWDRAFSQPPNAKESGSDRFVHPNRPFQDWVTDTFQVTIPRTALEVIKHPAKMDDKQSEDPFFNWIKRNQ